MTETDHPDVSCPTTLNFLGARASADKELVHQSEEDVGLPNIARLLLQTLSQGTLLLDVSIYIYIYTCSYIHAYIHTHTNTHIHTSVHPDIVHAYIHAYMHTYIHTYIHTYVHTYIHTLHIPTCI